MAKLKGIIKLEGTLDNLTFYKGKEGYLVKTKSGVSKEFKCKKCKQRETKYTQVK